MWGDIHTPPSGADHTTAYEDVKGPTNCRVEHSWEVVAALLWDLRTWEYSVVSLTFSWIKGKPYKARYVSTSNHIPLFDRSQRTIYGCKLDEIPAKIKGFFQNPNLEVFITPELWVPWEYNIGIYDPTQDVDAAEVVWAALDLVDGIMDPGNNNSGRG